MADAYKKVLKGVRVLEKQTGISLLVELESHQTYFFRPRSERFSWALKTKLVILEIEGKVLY